MGSSETTKNGSTSKRKPGTHKCTQEDKLHLMDSKITTLHNIITGNGTPEKGILFQMAMFNKNHQELIKSINDMNEAIRGITLKYDESIKIAQMANNAIKSYKRETDSFEKGRKSGDETKEKKSVTTWRKISGSVAIIAVSFTIIYAIYKDVRAERKADLEVKVNRIENWMELWDFSPITRGGRPILDTTKFEMKGDLIKEPMTPKKE